MNPAAHAMPVTAIILAGGQARRMGGADKGLLLLRQRPLLAWMLECIQPQVDEVLISANRNLAQYAQFGHPVVSDAIRDFAGPLAGLLRAMQTARHELILTAPCDTPFLPADLVQRLSAALIRESAQIAIPSAGGYTHHAIMLCQRNLAPSLNAYLESGARKVMEWQGKLKQVVVPFDDAEAFTNFNTPEDLANAENATGRG